MEKLSNWRYIPHTDALLDRLSLYNGEDDLIAKLDGEVIEPLSTEALHNAIESLPPVERETVWLHIFEGKSFSQIGRMRKMSKQAVHQTYQKAIQKLKDIMNESI